MGDYRYKINGSAEPYTIKLYKSDNTEISSFCGDNIYCNNYICGFISGLNPGTYYICATDNIGTGAKGSNFTIPDDYVFYTPPYIEYCLGGTINNSNPDNYYINEDGNNKIKSTKALEGNQKVDLQFNVIVSGNSSADTTNVYGCVEICKNTTIVYNKCASNGCSNENTTITLEPGDTISYTANACNNPSTTMGAPPPEGILPIEGVTISYADISLINVNSVGDDAVNASINSSYDDISIKNVRTPESTDTYRVGLYGCVSAPANNKQEGCGDINVYNSDNFNSPSLNTTDYVRVNLTLCAKVYDASDPGSAYAIIYKDNVKIKSAEITLTNDSCSVPYTFDLDGTHDYGFCVCSFTPLDGCACSYVNIDTITPYGDFTTDNTSIAAYDSDGNNPGYYLDKCFKTSYEK